MLVEILQQFNHFVDTDLEGFQHDIKLRVAEGRTVPDPRLPAHPGHLSFLSQVSLRNLPLIQTQMHVCIPPGTVAY